MLDNFSRTHTKLTRGKKVFCFLSSEVDQLVATLRGKGVLKV